MKKRKLPLTTTFFQALNTIIYSIPNMHCTTNYCEYDHASWESEQQKTTTINYSNLPKQSNQTQME